MMKILSGVTAAIITLCTLTSVPIKKNNNKADIFPDITITSNAASPIVGDVCSDGCIDVFDLIAMKQMLVDSESDKINMMTADINADGRFDSDDVRQVQEYLLCKRDSFDAAETTVTTTTTSTNSTTATTTTNVTTVSYYYRYDYGYYINEDGYGIGPDSGEEIYYGFLDFAERMGIEHYKIVYYEDIIPYAYVMSGLDYNGDIFQAAPIGDIEKICSEFYQLMHKEYGKELNDSFSYVFWIPGEMSDFGYTPWPCDCSIEHELVRENRILEAVLYDYWQLIPTDENGNDILCLGSNNPIMKKALSNSE
ncbi:MAG: dockerin type I repeat-containing protein [Ruminococcus sp.]|nr:dockerin type I repeat-containing protein [Ruminococcus sp.]